MNGNMNKKINNMSNGFNPISQQSMMQQQMGGNFSNCFNGNPTLIGKPDFSNKGGVLHNNLNNDLHELKISEYKVHIHTKDRDKEKCPSIFNIRVPVGSNDAFSIKKKFKKVKYISLDSVILPRTIAIDVSDIASNNLYPAASRYPSTPSSTPDLFTTLTNHKYLILKIEELETNKNLGTSSFIDKNTFILTDDGSMGIDNVIWKPIHGTVIYPSSKPFCLSKLSITLYDEFENEIKLVDQNGNLVINNTLTGASPSRDYNSFVLYNQNSSSVVYTDKVMQVLFNFTIGEIENELSTSNYY